jgi:hypothetical protein
MDATGPTSPDDTLLAEPNIGPEKDVPLQRHP